MPDFLKLDNKFNILSLNTGSLLAKIDEIRIFIHGCESQGVNFDCICIQESWLDKKACEDLKNLFQIDNYECYPQEKYCSSKGGLVIYIKSNYNFEKIFTCPHSNIWEGLFLEITSKNSDFRIVVGDIYKPPQK